MVKKMNEEEQKRIVQRYCTEKITAHQLMKEEKLTTREMESLLRKYLKVIQGK